MSLPIIRAGDLVGLGVCAVRHFLWCSNIKKEGGLRLVTVQNAPSHARPLPSVRESKDLITSRRPLRSPRLPQDMNEHSPGSFRRRRRGPRRGRAGGECV